MKDQIENLISQPDFLEHSAWRRRYFCNNDLVVNEGDQGNALFFIEKGRMLVNMQVDLADGRTIQQGIGNLSAGDIFGEVCLHGPYVRTASVMAVSDAVLIEIDAKYLVGYLGQHPQLGYYFYKSLFDIFIKRLDIANNRVGSLFVWGLKAHGIEKHL